MPAPASVSEFLDLVRKSGILDEARLQGYINQIQATVGIPTETNKFAGLMIRDGLLTYFQAEQLLQGKWKRFSIGKYKVLERLGSGGMGQVFLCEHKLMRRRVALKVLPTAKAEDASSLERFYREARAVASLDHPNIVRAYDIDQDENLHFLVMEYVDGSSLQEVVKKHGPMDILRACHYIHDSAVGLHHAYAAGLIHRDIKPGNILIDRTGTVKILDMGLARFFHDHEDIITKKYDENVLGTADYLAPEQAIDSHSVDVRADIYSLGATFYFLLTGSPPFQEGTVAQKLIWHQTRNPRPIKSLRPETPDDLLAIIERMMAKDPKQRYQAPQEVVAALEPWTQTPVGPPPETEMPRLSLAAQGGSPYASAPPIIPPARGPKLNPGSQAIAVPQVLRETAPPAPFATSSPAQGNAVIPPAQAAPIEPGLAFASTTSNEFPPAGSDRGPTAAAVTAPTATAVAERDHSDRPQVWESFGDTTEEPAINTPSAKSGTAYRSPRSLSEKSGKRSAKETRSRRNLFIGIGVGVAALAVGLFFVLGGGKTSNDGTGERKLIVSKKKTGTGYYDSIAKALENAQEGDRIQIDDEVIEESLVLTSKPRGTQAACPKNIAIEPLDLGKRVLWKVPTNASSAISLGEVEGISIQGFLIDGGNKARSGVKISNNASRLSFANLEIKATIDNAISLYGPGLDVKCTNLQISKTKTAVHIGRQIGNSLQLVIEKSSFAELSEFVLKFDEPLKGDEKKFRITVNDCKIEGNVKELQYPEKGKQPPGFSTTGTTHDGKDAEFKNAQQ